MYIVRPFYGTSIGENVQLLIFTSISSIDKKMNNSNKKENWRSVDKRNGSDIEKFSKVWTKYVLSRNFRRR